jgi:hypothetical protein
VQRLCGPLDLVRALGAVVGPLGPVVGPLGPVGPVGPVCPVGTNFSTTLRLHDGHPRPNSCTFFIKHDVWNLCPQSVTV